MEGIEKIVPVILAGAMAVVSLHVFPFSPSSGQGNRNVAKNPESGDEISELKEEDVDDGSVTPITVEWRNLICVLMDKSGQLVCFLQSIPVDSFLFSSLIWHFFLYTI